MESARRSRGIDSTSERSAHVLRMASKRTSEQLAVTACAAHRSCSCAALAATE